jgi:PAS domain S-box-containing protein
MMRPNLAVKEQESHTLTGVLGISIDEELRRSEERCCALLEYAPDGVLIADPKSRYIDANTSICRMLGYSRDELIGMEAADIVAPAEIRHIESALDTINAGSDYHREWKFRRKDGSVFPAEVRAIMMPDGFLMATIRDVTERRRAALAFREKDELLHAADRRLAQIVHGMTEACFALDEQWRFTFVNDRGLSLLRHSREQMLGHSIWQVFHKLVGTPMEAHYRRAMEERVPVAFEVLSPIAERWLDVRLFRTGEGLAAFLLDITDRKQIEHALRDSELRFGTAFRSSPAAIAINRRKDLVNLEVNAAFLRMFECRSEEIVGHTLVELDLLDRETVMALRGQLDATGRVDDLELAARTRLGKPLHLNVSIRTIELGGEACALSTLIDVTERYKAGQEVRDQLDELLRWQEVMLNREGRVQSLKLEVNELLAQGGQAARYANAAPQ